MDVVLLLLAVRRFACTGRVEPELRASPSHTLNSSPGMIAPLQSAASKRPPAVKCFELRLGIQESFPGRKKRSFS